jgi:hypothetical protein
MSDSMTRLHWHIAATKLERDNRARVLDALPATTMRDVLRLTAGPTARFITRHARALVAAVRAYWKEVQ